MAGSTKLEQNVNPYFLTLHLQTLRRVSLPILNHQLRTFLTVPSVCILIVNFLHNFAFNAGTYYLALFFQVCGSTIYLRPPLIAIQSVKGLTPLMAGLTMLPYSLGSSLASMPGLSSFLTTFVFI